MTTLAISSLPGLRALATRIGALAWPILIGQMAVIANGMIDTAMTGRYSRLDLAALAVGSATYVSVSVGLSGVIQALMPVIGRLTGQQDHNGIRHAFRQGLILALMLSLPGMALLWFPGPLLALAQATPDLTAIATDYLRWLALSLPVLLIIRAFGSLCIAIGSPAPMMRLQLFYLALKGLLSYWFIYGGLGLAAMGGPGCGLASMVSNLIAFGIIVVYLRYGQPFRHLDIYARDSWRIDFRAQKELLMIGIPMGLGYLIEVTAFTFMAIFIARLGLVPVGAHQIIASIAAMAYMLPMSISIGTGTLVAQALGANSHALAVRTGYTGIACSALGAALTGIILWLLREPILSLFTSDPAILANALPLLLFVAGYQLFDGAQSAAVNILRAYRVTLVPTIVYGIFLWLIGLGGGYVMGFNLTGNIPAAITGPAGFWMGNGGSLVLVSIVMLVYLQHVQRSAGKPAR